MSEPTRAYRYAVNVTPKPGILDPQGRAVERSLPHLGIEGVAHVRVGRRVELTVSADDEAAAGAIVERLAGELLSNPLIEAFEVEALGEVSPDATAAMTGAAG
jgi:phosphoribosylformylglycinamidine synthase